jgi:hypothetical protein
MQIRWLSIAAALGLAAMLGSAVTGDAGPSMSSAWLSITLSQDECVRKGSAAMRQQSFNTRFEVLANSSVYGERGDYTGLIRCAANKGIVFFVVAGPVGKICSRHMNAMRDNF